MKVERKLHGIAVHYFLNNKRDLYKFCNYAELSWRYQYNFWGVIPNPVTEDSKLLVMGQVKSSGEEGFRIMQLESHLSRETAKLYWLVSKAFPPSYCTKLVW